MAGVSPNFSPIDVLRVFRIMSGKPLSRAEMVKRLGIGEGSVRSILCMLKEEGLLGSTRAGHFLSAAGDGLAKDISSRITGPTSVQCGVFSHPFRAAIIVRDPDQPVDPIRLRDLALKWGADAALILIMREGSLNAPRTDAQLDLREMKERLDPPEGSLAIIAFSASQASADISALAAAVGADEDLRSIVMKRFGGKGSPIPL